MRVCIKGDIMTCRERVLCTIGHKEPDKVAKGEVCVEGDLANRILGTNYPHDYQHYERDKAIRERLYMDLIDLGDWPAEEIGKDENGNTIYRSLYGYEYKYSGLSKHITRPPIADILDAATYRKPDISKVSGDLLRKFKETTDLFVFGQIGGPVSMLDEMFDMEDYLVYCLTNPHEIRLISEKVMEFELEKAELFISSGADAIYLADDIAFNNGTFLPPEILESLVYPFYKDIVTAIKKTKDVPVFFHSDGDLRKVLDRIVECGFNGLQSLQPSANMDIASIKKRYGDVLCLFGNIDLDYVMTMASPQEVADTVKRTIDIAAPGGGFILSTCNTLVNAIPVENAIAMYETAEQYTP